MGESEIKQQIASLNTQLRFGRHQAALTEAYKLRTLIQLSGLDSVDALFELQRAERVIGQLESNRLVGIQKLINWIVRIAKASLNPEDDKENTLLDDFRVTQASEDEDDFAEPDMPEDEMVDDDFDAVAEAPYAPRPTSYAYSEEDEPDGWGTPIRAEAPEGER